MAQVFTPLAGCLENANERATALADCVVHLFQDTLAPTPSTPLADYTANEADYDGYATFDIATWNGPILSPTSGYEILSPLILFTSTPGDPVTTNNVAGLYLVDSLGQLRRTIVYDAPEAMGNEGEGIADLIVIIFPTGV